MSIKARLKRLEKKIAANEPPQRVLGISIDGTPKWRTEERDGVLYCLPRLEPGEFKARCLAQQSRLMKELAGYAAQLDEEGTVEHGKATSPNETGEAPLKPGQKRARYLFTVENGVETQLDRLTGERIKIGRI